MCGGIGFAVLGARGERGGAHEVAPPDPGTRGGVGGLAPVKHYLRPSEAVGGRALARVGKPAHEGEARGGWACAGVLYFP